MTTTDDHAETIYRWLLKQPRHKAYLIVLAMDVCMPANGISTGEFALALSLLKSQGIIDKDPDSISPSRRKVWIVG